MNDEIIHATKIEILHHPLYNHVMLCIKDNADKIYRCIINLNEAIELHGWLSHAVPEMIKLEKSMENPQ